MKNKSLKLIHNLHDQMGQIIWRPELTLHIILAYLP